MTADLHALADAISNQSPRIKAFCEAVADILQPSAPPPPPPPPPPTTKARVGVIDNIGGGGSKTAFLSFGAKLTREDTANAASWFAANGIDWIQIVYPGEAPHPQAYAHEVVACPKNEPYWDGVNPATYGPTLAAEVARVKALKLGKPVLVPLVAYGWTAGNNGMDGKVAPGNYKYPNGGYPIPDSWVGQIEKAVPGFLKSEPDGFAVHPYFNVPAFHVLDTVRAELTQLGCAQPFWITEAGTYYGTDLTGRTQDGAAKTELAALAARSDVHCYLWYRLEAVSEGSASWGLLNTDGSQRAAYSIVRAAL